MYVLNFRYSLFIGGVGGVILLLISVGVVTAYVMCMCLVDSNNSKNADIQKNQKDMDHSNLYYESLKSIKAVRDYENTEIENEYLRKKVSELQAEFSNLYYKNLELNSTIREYENASYIAPIIEEEFQKFWQNTGSNLTAIPYMAGIMADFQTYGLEILARKLDWGSCKERAKKVESLRTLRKKASDLIEQQKEAQYKLAYLLELFPALSDILDCDFSQLPPLDINSLPDHDNVKDYLSKEEWEALSESERNQLALNRYVNSHRKTKWQIGRDYELYVGYTYSKKGYDVNYTGSYLKLEDLGRDLIVKKDQNTLIIQCKYWSKEKIIHEKHIMQLYGTMTCYQVENNQDPSNVNGVFITNTRLSETAKKMATYLNIRFVEDFEIGEFPRIKCNIGHDENGMKTKIYHLPFDQQYDNTKINNEGEFFAMTVEEAESAGFRRAFKWFSENSTSAC